MKIEAIEIYHVRMPLIQPWRTAYGEDQAIESVLVKLSCEGESAWGESSPLAAPCYSPEWALGCFTLIRDWLAPELLGEEIPSGQALQDRLANYKGNPFAKAALDTAWWVLDSKLAGKPLHQHLGATRDQALVGADFGVTDSIDQLLDQLEAAVAAGFTRFKLKFRPGWDLPMLEAVRNRFPNQRIHIDCNSGYRLSDLPLFRQLDQFKLAMIEQPLAYDDLIDHAKLQQEIETPICLDESINSLNRARQAIQLQSCQFINIKPGRVGGLTPAIAIHDLCRDAKIPCWVGGMLESAVGSRICTALAMLDNFTYPADIFPSDRFYRQDLSQPQLTLQNDNGKMVVQANSTPGIDATPDQKLLVKWCVNRAEVAAIAE